MTHEELCPVGCIEHPDRYTPAPATVDFDYEAEFLELASQPGMEALRRECPHLRVYCPACLDKMAWERNEK